MPIASLIGRYTCTGFDATNLNNMRQFYLAYQNLDAVRQDSLSWTHYRTLMRLPLPQRDFYSRMAAGGGGVHASWIDRSSRCSTSG